MCFIQPDIEDVKGIIAPFEDPYIYVIHSTPRLYVSTSNLKKNLHAQGNIYTGFSNWRFHFDL